MSELKPPPETPERMTMKTLFNDPTDGGLINLRIVMRLLSLAKDHANATDDEVLAYMNVLVSIGNKLVCCWKHWKRYQRIEASETGHAKKVPLDPSQSATIGLAQDLHLTFDDFLVQTSSCIDRAAHAPRVFLGDRWPRSPVTSTSALIAAITKHIRHGHAAAAKGLIHTADSHRAWLDDILRLAGTGVESDLFRVYAIREGDGIVVRVPRFSTELSMVDFLEMTWRSLFCFVEDFLAICLVLRLKPGLLLQCAPSPVESGAPSPWTVVREREIVARLGEPRQPTGKVGRNDPCPCGSGNKFKRCCLGKSTPSLISTPLGLRVVTPETLAVQRSERPIIQALFKGMRARAIGNVVMMRPPSETFHEFLWNHLRSVLGKEWYLNEVSKPDIERHQIVRWFFALQAWQKRTMVPENAAGTGWGATPSGDVQALAMLAYDVYTLRHAKSLPDPLLHRLRDRHEFQGARYELAVAAIFLRGSFSVEFLTRSEFRHGEFIARHASLGARVVVEAKSRRRSGVLHERGPMDNDAVIKGDVYNLFAEAKGQHPQDLPFLIFIDLNSPPGLAASPRDAAWFADLKNLLDTHDAVSEGRPDVFNALFITNFATHYLGHGLATTSGERLLALGREPRQALADAVISAVWEAVQRYGQVPMDSPEQSQ
jgi:hypothetical protein